MAFLDDWLNGRPRNHARDAKLYLLLSYAFSLVFIAYYLSGIRGLWEMTWQSLFVPLLALAASVQLYAQALVSRRAYQAELMPPATGQPPSV